MSSSETVPAAMRGKFELVSQATDAFCEQHLNDEYRAMIRQATAAMCRKRPSPLLSGTVNAWAAGIVHAVGAINFLFDKSQTPHCKASKIYGYFQITEGTGQTKSKTVRKALGMRQLDHHWTLRSRLASSMAVWMLEVNGYFVDARYMPLEVQLIAYSKGYIPYVPRPLCIGDGVLAVTLLE